ncbi:MAG: AAA family ATPase, partial [Streptosporangiaceae bacterium]
PDLADLVSHAEAHGAKVILAGDTGQLQAVENGGGMSLLAGVLGCVQLAEPVRFRAGWERAASLRLRDGDVSVLADYDQHGRITGGDPDQMIDAATKAYVALTLEGKDALLMAADHARRQELSRRIRDDLVHLGLVDSGPAVRLANGASASAGDLIVCTRNDHAVQAGEPGRTLANGDLLRIEAITGRGLLVRRALDADPRTGQRRWTERNFVYRDYRNAELGYAVTDHVAQSRTVHTGLALITGTEDRQHAYVALSRGTSNNLAFVFTVSPKRADPAPGPRPAPELPRYDRIRAERDGRPAPAATTVGTGEAAGVLADVLERDGQQLSASETWQRNLSNADHLAILNAMWAGETRAAREQRYQNMFTRALPPAYQGEPTHQAKWLWRTLRAVELAGLDPQQVLTAAVGERDLAGSRDVASVIDARIRARINPLIPQPAGPWSAQIPDISDPERRAFATEVAAMMDARKERIAEHAAEHASHGRSTPSGWCPSTRSTGWTGSAAPARSAPTASCTATTTPLRESGPNRRAARRTSERPGTRPSAPSDLSRGLTCAGCRTGRCCTCATPTPSKPPGPPNGSATSSARSAAAPKKPTSPRSEPTPRRRPPGAAIDKTLPPHRQNWPPATGPCMTPTASAKVYSPPSWTTGPNGRRPPPSSGTSPWPPTPSCAAATPTSGSTRCAPPSRSRSPRPSATNSR